MFELMNNEMIENYYNTTDQQNDLILLAIIILIIVLCGLVYSFVRRCKRRGFFSTGQKV